MPDKHIINYFGLTLVPPILYNITLNNIVASKYLNVFSDHKGSYELKARQNVTVSLYRHV